MSAKQEKKDSHPTDALTRREKEALKKVNSDLSKRLAQHPPKGDEEVKRLKLRKEEIWFQAKGREVSKKEVGKREKRDSDVKAAGRSETSSWWRRTPPPQRVPGEDFDRNQARLRANKQQVSKEAQDEFHDVCRADALLLQPPQAVSYGSNYTAYLVDFQAFLSAKRTLLTVVEGEAAKKQKEKKEKKEATAKAKAEAKIEIKVPAEELAAKKKVKVAEKRKAKKERRKERRSKAERAEERKELSTVKVKLALAKAKVALVKVEAKAAPESAPKEKSASEKERRKRYKRARKARKNLEGETQGENPS